jgi:hypothetical protein
MFCPVVAKKHPTPSVTPVTDDAHKLSASSSLNTHHQNKLLFNQEFSVFSK